MPASDIEAHEAWNAKVAQAFYEAAENAAAGHFPPHISAGLPVKTTFYVDVEGRRPS